MHCDWGEREAAALERDFAGFVCSCGGGGVRAGMRVEIGLIGWCRFEGGSADLVLGLSDPVASKVMTVLSYLSF